MVWTLVLAASSLLEIAASSGSVTILPKHFAIPVRTAEEITASDVELGAPVELKISYDIRWQGCLVFREGAPVMAIVSETHGPGAVGRPSLVVLDILSTTTVDGTAVPLSGSIRSEGEDRMMESIGSAAGVCCLGIFLPGGRQSVGKGVGTVALTTAEVEIQCAED